MADFTSYAEAQYNGESTESAGSGGKGIQIVDLAMFDGKLQGFSGGFVRSRPVPSPAYYEKFNKGYKEFLSNKFSDGSRSGGNVELDGNGNSVPAPRAVVPRSNATHVVRPKDGGGYLINPRIIPATIGGRR